MSTNKTLKGIAKKLCLVLCVCMMITALPMTAFAAPDDNKIKVTVVGSDNKAVKDAVVILKDSDDKQVGDSKKTKQDGKCDFDVTNAGTYTVLASKDNLTGSEKVEKGTTKKEVTVKITAAPAHIHDLKKVDAKAETCTDSGNIEYWFCQDETCGKKFSDSEGKNEVTNVTVNAKNHSLVWTEEEGTHVQKCQNEGCTYTTDSHAADWDEVNAVIATQPAVGVEGAKIVSCKHEGCTITKTEKIDEIVPCTNHVKEIVQDGKEYYLVCKNAGCEYKEKVTLVKIDGHFLEDFKYENGKIKINKEGQPEVDHDRPIANVPVEVRQNGQLVGKDLCLAPQAMTSNKGAYEFYVVPGTYDLVATYNELSYTITVNTSAKTHNCYSATAPDSGVTHEVVVDEESIIKETPVDLTKMQEVSGLKEVADKVAENNTAASKIDVKLNVKEIKDYTVEEPQTQEEEQLKAEQDAIYSIVSDDTTVSFLDMSLIKTVDGVANPIHDTVAEEGAGILEIIVPYVFPAETDINKVHVIRNHQGSVKEFVKLDAQAATDARVDGTCFVDMANDKIYIYTSKFSTYAVTYGDMAGTPAASDYFVKPEKSTTENGRMELGRRWITGEEIAKGQLVNITLTPDQGFMVTELRVRTEKSGRDIEFTKVSENVYSFRMPACDVIVGVDFGCSRDQFCPIAAFEDAIPNAWYHDGLHFCIENGIMIGYPSGLFGPTDYATRGQAITMLYRLDGCPAVEAVVPFTDVNEGTVLEKAVIWAAQNGITEGIGEDKFGPDQIITRQEFVAMIGRYSAYKNITVSSNADLSAYKDAASVSGYAMESMIWSCANGIIGGNGAGNLNPEANASRAEIATILYRFCTNILGK